MTTVALILAVAFVAMSALYVIVACNRDRLRDENKGLRDQLRSTESALKHWRGVAEGYHDAPGTRTSGPRAREPRWRDKAGNPVGFNDNVVPLQRKGGAS